MKILITGGAGFIGANLALKLMESQNEVVVLDNLSPQIHGENPDTTSPLYNLIKNKCAINIGDVVNRKNLEDVLNNVDVVVHLAAETGTGQSMYEILKYANTNQTGTALLLDLMVNTKNKIKKIIIASSRAIYGEGKYFSEKYGIVYPESRATKEMEKGNFELTYKDDPTPLKCLPTDEDSKLHPTSIYGITKLNQEQLVLCVCKAMNINAVSLRFQNVYGPGQSLNNPYTGILSVFSSQILNHQPLNIFEDGNESRDFVYIDDVIDAIKLSIKARLAPSSIFNVGFGLPISVFKVAETLVNKFQINKIAKPSGNFRIGDIRHNFADISKIKKELGFSPKIDFETGISRYTDWVKKQNIFSTRVTESFSEMKAKGLLK